MSNQTRQRQVLRAYLHPHGSQGALARRLGISESYCSLLLAGKRPATARLARRIAKVTGIPVESFLPTEDDRTA